MGQTAPAPWEASPPTGSPANGADCQKCNFVEDVLATAFGCSASRQPLRPARHAVPPYRRQSWQPRSEPRTRSRRCGRRPVQRATTRRRTAPRATAPVVEPRTDAPAVAGTELQPLGRRFGMVARPSWSRSAGSGRRARAARRRHGFSLPGRPCPVPWGRFPCQRRVQGIEVGSDGAAVPENPRDSNGKSAPTGGAGEQVLA